MTMTNLRGADLATLAQILTEQHASKHDVVVRADSVRYDRGVLVVPGAGLPELTDDGVSTGDLRLTMLDQAEGQLADRLGIPRVYARKCREHDETARSWDAESGLPEHAWLLDENVNRWLGASPADARMLVRSFVDETGGGVCRAVLSDRYRAIDHLDGLTAAMAAVQQAAPNPGDVTVESVDLTASQMTVRFVAPAISELAPDLLAGYRSPFTGETGDSNPTVFAGFVLRNSETGGGAFTIVPRLVVQVCRNGLTMTRDALREIHLGSRLSEGSIDWSDATRERNVDLIVAQATDAVRTFLDRDWMRAKIAELTEKAARPITAPAETIERVGKSLRFSEAERESLLASFIQGGQLTAGGVLQAVTAMSQGIPDADRAWEIEASGMDALALAAL